MKIVVRADSSLSIGSGHIMRCLTLAKMLESFGAEVHFILLDLEGNLSNVLIESGFMVHLISTTIKDSSLPIDILLQEIHEKSIEDAEKTISILKNYASFDWIIVDHYALDWKWEELIRPHVKRVFVIDDMANRKHECDVLLDQNFQFDMELRYKELVPENCINLLGPRYLLFRPEFRNIKPRTSRNGSIKNILIFFGGSDSTNETVKALKACNLLERKDFHIDVVVGGSNPHHNKIQQLCKEIPGAVFHRQINYMAELMNKADLAIGAGGSTTWERCLLGLPALIVILAENQQKGILNLEKVGAFINMGWYSSINAKEMSTHIYKLLEDPEKVKEMSHQALSLVDADNLYDLKDWERIFYRCL